MLQMRPIDLEREWFITMDEINSSNLAAELEAAGIAFSGIRAEGCVVWDVDGTTEIQDREDVAAVIAAHDPVDNPGIPFGAADLMQLAFVGQNIDDLLLSNLSDMVKLALFRTGCLDKSGDMKQVPLLGENE